MGSRYERGGKEMADQAMDIEFIVQAVKDVLSELEANNKQPYLEIDSSDQNLDIGYRKGQVEEIGIARQALDVREVGIAIGPAYGLYMSKTIHDLDHVKVLKELMAGIEEEGMIPRIIRGTRTSDVAFIANDVAKIVGSGIAIGIQSKGTTVIHQKDLYPLTNLELFPQAPVISMEMYRQIGKNAGKYAKGEQVVPVKVVNDIFSRPKYQVKAALMHTKETEYVVKRGEYIEISTDL
jgi:glycerol dehydratase medium subunit/propanediol dehydratase medium subunit